MKILLTGAAGFIGMHTCLHLLNQTIQIIGIDNLSGNNETLKQARLNCLLSHEHFIFHKVDICDRHAITSLFMKERPEYVIHLAACAGVRQSINDPNSYIDTNVNGFLNILEACRALQIRHLIYASSSSVYGGNETLPFSEHHSTAHPLSLYAATKKTNELMAHTYSHLFNIPTTGLRFFTVYGPWGRPDMAPFLFTKTILEGGAIHIYNQGELIRDFTYVDDIVEGIIGLIDKPAVSNLHFDPLHPDPATSNAPYRIFNIGNNQPIVLKDFIHELELALGIKAQKIYQPMQPGDMRATHADMSELKAWDGFQAQTPLSIGVKHFVNWYLDYFGRNEGMP